MAQSGGVVLGGDVVVGDVNAAGLVHLDHVVTEPIVVIAEVTLLGATEETNQRATADISSCKQSFTWNKYSFQSIKYFNQG